MIHEKKNSVGNQAAGEVTTHEIKYKTNKGWREDEVLGVCCVVIVVVVFAILKHNH